MTPVQFRRLVLSLDGAEESSHQHHPDFRVNGKIFATMGYPDPTHAMVKLTTEQQAEFIHDCPDVFSPAAGAWGRQGSTVISLPQAKGAILQPAVQAAWQNAITAAAASKKKKQIRR
jgi:YjbR